MAQQIIPARAGSRGTLTQEICAALLDKWDIELTPQFRGFQCADCGVKNMTAAWHIHCIVGGYKREFHLCWTCGARYGLRTKVAKAPMEHVVPSDLAAAPDERILPVREKMLIVIAHHNGSMFIEEALQSLDAGYDIAVVDTGSREDEWQNLLRIAWRFPNVRLDATDGGYCVGAYEHAFRTHPHYRAYLFIHDSMRAKAPKVAAAFEGNGDVVAWIGFPMSFDGGGTQEQYLRRHYGDLTDVPPTAIFGPAFYATNAAMTALAERNLFPPHPTNRDELCASERGYAIAFHRAGFSVNYLEEYDNDRLDGRRDYLWFDKFRPNRP